MTPSGDMNGPVPEILTVGAPSREVIHAGQHGSPILFMGRRYVAERDGWPSVQGRCPACAHRTLFIGSGGYVTCSRLDCTEPDAASYRLEAMPRPHVSDSDARAMREALARLDRQEGRS